MKIIEAVRLGFVAVIGLAMMGVCIDLFAGSVTYYSGDTPRQYSAILDSTGDTVIFPNDSGGFTTVANNIELGACADMKSLVGSIILDSGTTESGEPAGDSVGYGLLDSAVIRFGTRLGSGAGPHTGDIALDSVNCGGLPCTLWVSHILNDTLLKSDLYIDFVIFDTAQIDSIVGFEINHKIRWNIIGRE